MRILSRVFALLTMLALLISCSEKKEMNGEKVELSYRQPTLPILAKKDTNTILEISVKIKDSLGVPLTAFNVNLEGTTDISDIKDLSIVYSENDDFKNPQTFGEATAVSSTVKIEGNETLSEGEYNFRLIGSLKGIPELTNNIAAEIVSLEFGDNKILKSEPVDTLNPQRIGIALREKGENEVHTYRIPGLATTNKGTLIAVYDVRYDSSADLQGNVDVGMSRSTDGGQTWEDMAIIMDMNKFGGRPEDQNGIGDPAVLVDRNTNTIWVAALWLSGHDGARAWNASGPGMSPTETGQFVLVKSEDDGKTWSEPINITEQIKKPEWRLFFNGPGSGISMEDGTLVFAAQFRDAEGVPHSTIVYSKDHGKTWEVGTGAKSQTTEAQVVELADGGLMLNMRDNRNHSSQNGDLHGRSVAVTYDMGKTWQEHPTSRKALPESTCMASFISFDTKEHGQVLFFSNPNSTTDRSKMTIKASLDQGMTWPEKYHLELYEKRGYGYSCLTKIDDNHIGILYEGAGELYFEKVNIDEILE